MLQIESAARLIVRANGDSGPLYVRHMLVARAPTRACAPVVRGRGLQRPTPRSELQRATSKRSGAESRPAWRPARIITCPVKLCIQHYLRAICFCCRAKAIREVWKAQLRFRAGSLTVLLGGPEAVAAPPSAGTRKPAGRCCASRGQRCSTLRAADGNQFQRPSAGFCACFFETTGCQFPG